MVDKAKEDSTCEYCDENEAKDILNSEIDELDDVFLTFSDDSDVFDARYIKTFYELSNLRVFYDRGCLRLTRGDDIGCLDHSEDRVVIKYCPMCGRKLG